MKFVYVTLLAFLLPFIASATPTITGPSTVCVGSTITLSATPPGGYWSTSSGSIATVSFSTGVVVGISAGTAIITYNDSASGMAVVSITVMAGPSAPAAIAGPTTTTVGGHITLTDATSGGAWSSSAASIASVSATTGVVTGMSVGTATISYTVTNSCGSASATYVITVGSTLNVAELGMSPEISLYPNPATGILNIDLANSVEGRAQITISDITGKTVTTQGIDLAAAANSVDVSNLENGIYFISIKSGAVNYNSKIVIAH